MNVPDLYKSKLEFTSYVIKDNKLYYNCHGRCAGYAEDFTEYLNGIVQNNIFKDTMFYICANEGIDYNNNQKWRDEPHTLDLIENVPAFMFNRDTNKRFEKKKWMIPDPYVTGIQNIAIGNSWGDVVEMIKEKSEKIEFANKRS